jgi:hypothetical protein
MRSVNPVADEWTEDYVLFAASSRTVLLTEPFKRFLEYAEGERLRPVLLTDVEAELSPFVTMAMLGAGGFWAVQTATGAVFNGLTGYQITGFSDLWEQPSEDRLRIPLLAEASATPAGVLMFDLHAHQRAAATTLIGDLGGQLVTSLGGSPLDVWGLVEPLASGWDTRRLTEVARAGMPDSETVLTRGPDGSFCTMQVVRTPRGLLEHVKGGVPIGAYPFELAGAVERASAALTLIAERFQPTVGFVSLAEFDPGAVQGVSAKRPEAPLAVVIGPRAVHEMKIDVDKIVQFHDATVLGRRRVPSLLVRFSRTDAGLWEQLAHLTRNIGPANVLAASGVMRRA